MDDWDGMLDHILDMAKRESVYLNPDKILYIEERRLDAHRRMYIIGMPYVEVKIIAYKDRDVKVYYEKECR